MIPWIFTGLNFMLYFLNMVASKVIVGYFIGHFLLWNTRRLLQPAFIKLKRLVLCSCSLWPYIHKSSQMHSTLGLSLLFDPPSFGKCCGTYLSQRAYI